MDYSKEAVVKAFKKQRTQRDVLEEECRELWRFIIYLKANFKCEYPGCKFRWEKLDAHHYFSKGAYPHLRFDLQNGICLCSRHHTAGFCRESAHSDPHFREKILGLFPGFEKIGIRTEDWENILTIRASQSSNKLDLNLERLYLIQELRKYKEEIILFENKINIDLINKYQL